MRIGEQQIFGGSQTLIMYWYVTPQAPEFSSISRRFVANSGARNYTDFGWTKEMLALEYMLTQSARYPWTKDLSGITLVPHIDSILRWFTLGQSLHGWNIADTTKNTKQSINPFRRTQWTTPTVYHRKRNVIEVNLSRALTPFEQKNVDLGMWYLTTLVDFDLKICNSCFPYRHKYFIKHYVSQWRHPPFSLGAYIIRIMRKCMINPNSIKTKQPSTSKILQTIRCYLKNVFCKSVFTAY